MEFDLKKIKEILLDIRIRGVGAISPHEATGYLVCLKSFNTDDLNLRREIEEVVFQLDGQSKLNLSDYKDHQKRQQVIDLILRLDKNTRDLFIEKGLDTIVLVRDQKMRAYLEEILLIMESMDKRPNLSEVVDMFRKPDLFA